MIGTNLRKIILQLVLLFCMLKKYPAYVSKHNSNHDKQVILLMIVNEGGPKGQRWHYLAIKNNQQ